MKKLFILMAGIIWFMPGFAQNELTVSGGLAFPAGDFASTSGGAAKMGFLGDVMYQHQMLDSKLWLAGLARYQSNKIDIAEFERAFPDVQISTTNWTAFSILVGPIVKFDVSETSSFEPRILLGYMSANSPKVTASSGTATAIADSDNGGAFAAMLGASFKFRASDRMSIAAGVDYLTANPKFTVTANADGMSASEESSQQISTFNVTAGLTFRLR